MKILILSDDFPPTNNGGAEVVAFNLAKSFQKLGNNIFVISTIREKSQAGQFDENGLKIFRIYTNYHERWRAYLSIYNPQTISQVKAIIRQVKPDIVHIHNIHYYLSYYCLKIAKKYCDKVFLTAHDVMLFHYGKLFEFINQNDLKIPKEFSYKITHIQQIKRFKKRYNPLRNVIIRHYLKYTDKIIAVSNTLKKALNQNSINNVEVIHNGIDVKNWQIEEKKIKEFQDKYNLKNKKVVLFGGRLSALKGGDKIIEAIKLVSRKASNVVLLVLGKKDCYAQKMRKLAKKKGVNLILTGWIESDELKSAYYNSDVVVTPSIYLDPFNLINIEGMVCKKPVVGTCFGGTAEIIIDNNTGYIVNPFDTRAMAEKIINLLKNPDKAEQFGLSGYNRIKQEFSLEKQIKKYLEKFRSQFPKQED